MKTWLFIIFVVCFSFLLSSQNESVLVLQPDSQSGKDARLHELTPDLNMGDAEEFITYYWTFNGQESAGVSLIEFDLSELPMNVIIIDAKLSLYYPNSSSAGQYGSNASCLKLITEYWDENSVTWSTKPNTMSSNSVILPSSNSSNQDYIDIDVTNFVQYWNENPNSNFGIMIELIENELYRSMKFASSDYIDVTRHPKLEIHYIKDNPQIDCMILKPGPDNGIDSRLRADYPYINFGDATEILSYCWTFDGEESIGYSLLKFDLSELPDNIAISSAKLSLFYPNSPSAGQAGENHCYLKRVVSEWQEYEVTWDNQPSVTELNKKYLSSSTSPNQSYTDILLTDFVQFWYENPNQNFGMKLEIINPILYKSMKFASSDYYNQNLWPELEICYSYISTNAFVEDNLSTKAYPNPTDGLISINLNKNLIGKQLSLYDVTGRLVKKFTINDNCFTLDLTNYTKGVYFCVFESCQEMNFKLIKL